MNNQLISIVMPAKNASAFIEECLDSILSQTYSNWELIVVDDTSSDDTLDLITTYTNNDPRIMGLSATGTGIVEALRQAYQNSSGKFITRMDADDVMAPKKLAVLFENLQKFGRGHVATGGVSYFSETNLGNGYKRYADWLNALTIDGSNYDDVYKECVIPSPCWMLYRSDFEQCGAFRPNVYPEDYDLCFRFYQEDMTVIPSDEILHYWRDHSERASRNDENYSDNTFLDLKIDYFIELDFDSDRQLVVWGAGDKGKHIAKSLIEHDVEFQWVSNNPKKVDKTIYGTLLEHEEKVQLDENPQVIIAVANPEEQEKIKSSLEQNDRQATVDNFYFC